MQIQKKLSDCEHGRLFSQITRDVPLPLICGPDQGLYTVNHDQGMWTIPCILGCPPKMITITRSFHGDMMARMVVKINTVSDPFPVSNEVNKAAYSNPLYSAYY